MPSNAKTIFLLQLVINITVFFATILITYGIVTHGLGWKPESKLAPSKRGLTWPQIFVLVLTISILSATLCFKCNAIKEGVVSGVLFVLVLKAFYEWNAMRT